MQIIYWIATLYVHTEHTFVLNNYVNSSSFN